MDPRPDKADVKAHLITSVIVAAIFGSIVCLIMFPVAALWVVAVYAGIVVLLVLALVYMMIYEAVSGTGAFR